MTKKMGALKSAAHAAERAAEAAMVAHVIESFMAWNPASGTNPYSEAAQHANQKRAADSPFCNSARAHAIAQVGLAEACARIPSLLGRYSAEQIAQTADALAHFGATHWWRSRPDAPAPLEATT